MFRILVIIRPPSLARPRKGCREGDPPCFELCNISTTALYKRLVERASILNQAGSSQVTAQALAPPPARQEEPASSAASPTSVDGQSQTHAATTPTSAAVVLPPPTCELEPRPAAVPREAAPLPSRRPPALQAPASVAAVPIPRPLDPEARRRAVCQQQATRPRWAAPVVGVPAEARGGGGGGEEGRPRSDLGPHPAPAEGGEGCD